MMKTTNERYLVLKGLSPWMLLCGLLGTTACSENQPVARESEVSHHASSASPATQKPVSEDLSATPVAPAPAGSLTLVTDRSQVCMVNNQFMGRPQIPVEVGGHTYFGCCEMCKGRLVGDAAARSATDPVSNHAVDKSIAVIAKDERGDVIYFENEANFEAYASVGRSN